METKIRIQMMNDFVIYVDEHQAEYLTAKSRKGTALMQYLIVHRGRSVANQRLLSTFWDTDNIANPENALKTLVSRMRTLLNDLYPGLGKCIVADRSAYRWESLPGMEIDLYEIEDIFDRLPNLRYDPEARTALYRRLMSLYTGDLLRACDTNEWALGRATALHNQYLAAVMDYVQILRDENKEEEIVNVCRSALDVDNFNDHLHIELMTALIRTNRSNEAMMQYEEVMHLYYHYLNATPSKELKEFYNQIISTGRNIEFSLEAIVKELQVSNSAKEALVCDYGVFKEVFNIEVRNITRLKSTIFLGIIMISKMNGQAMDTLKQGSVMRDLIDILRTHLRRGDVIAQFSPMVVAVLLPMVNYKTGDSVMERMKNIFYKQYPNSNVLFNYRISPVTEVEGNVVIHDAADRKT